MVHKAPVHAVAVHVVEGHLLLPTVPQVQRDLCIQGLGRVIQAVIVGPIQVPAGRASEVRRDVSGKCCCLMRSLPAASARTKSTMMCKALLPGVGPAQQDGLNWFLAWTEELRGWATQAATGLLSSCKVVTNPFLGRQHRAMPLGSRQQSRQRQRR